MLRTMPSKPGHTLCVDGVWVNFFLAREGAKVSAYNFRTLLESHENSWGTMVTLCTSRASAAKEISLLTSSPLLRGWTSPQGSTKWCPSTPAV